MSSLITGGTGFIGRHTAKLFQECGLRTVLLDNLTTSRGGDARWGSLVHGDITNVALVRRVLREHAVTTVIHLAASAHVSESMGHPAAYFANNLCATLALLDAMVAEGVLRFVFASSSAVYGNSLSTVWQENEAVRPVSPYGESKIAVERVLPWYGRAYGLQWVALRYFNAAGAEEHLGEEPGNSARIIPSVVHSAIGGGPAIDVFGTTYPTADGSAVRDYVHVSDVAHANLRAFQYLERGGAGVVVDIGAGAGVSVLQIIAEVSRQTGQPVSFHARQARPGDPGCTISDPSRAQSVLGWMPVRSGLSSIVASALHSCTAGAAPLPATCYMDGRPTQARFA